jgi:molybdenum cofactor cytidylyltransferase
MIAGLIPAAGHSRRMGRPKLALPLRGRTVLEHVVAALVEAGVAPVLVVLGPHVAELGDPARAAGAEVLLLPEATPDMRATVERGLAWLEAARPGPEDDWLLVPADHPALDAGVIRGLIAAPREPGRSIVVPTWQGRRGHPTLIGWGHVAGIRAHPAGEGLNAYLRGQAALTLEVPAAGPAVVEDLDTPEDYERLLGRPW